MIVNEVTTKLMSLGEINALEIYIFFYEKQLAFANEYKYLGNIVRSTEKSIQVMFSIHYSYLCDGANKASFVALQMPKNIEHPHPR